MPVAANGDVRPRRNFLIDAALLALAAAAAGTAYAAARLLAPLRARRQLVHIGQRGDFVPGSWRLLPDEPIYIVVEERGVAAISARCSHLGCTVRRRGEGFICPCHGSTFDSVGSALTPPAVRPLDWLQVRVVGDALFVDPTTVVATNTFVAPWGQRG
ncbi:MAG: Rieske 2Fe-2S domain-containing protein [Deltaproteobacteria bacterium]|nr:Rieske 2Fe-2S domain-containing protein [Deltaproteobacteria bacterium]